MSATAIQAWLAAAAGLLAAILGLVKYFDYKSKRDRMATVGAAFAATVESLASDSDVKRMAAAVLLRRFFDRNTEQGEAGAPYLKETVEVIAGMLRVPQTEGLQKVLADGLRYAHDLTLADLQGCNLQNSYLGTKSGDKRRLILSNADLFEADCSNASFREVIAVGAVFYRAKLKNTVLIGADLQKADFRKACLSGAKFNDATLSNAKFDGARIDGAQFGGAKDIPPEVAWLLDQNLVGRADAVVRLEPAPQ
jgi:hypothetical protein